MEVKLSLCACALLMIVACVTRCLAVKRVIVKKGQTLTLNCPIKTLNGTDHVEWRNPNGFLLSFNTIKVLKDKRTEDVTLTQSQYSISISDITFKDGGVYKCMLYSKQVQSKRYRVIVLSGPMLEKTEHEDKTIVKCSASENGQPPKLTWLLDNGLEIEAQPNYVVENASNKYTAVSLLHVKSKKRTTVKCVAQYPTLHGATLLDFVHIGSQGEEPSTTPEPISTTTQKVIIPTLVPQFTSTRFISTEYTESETTEEPDTGVSTTSYDTINVNETTESLSKTTEGTPVNTGSAVTTETDTFTNTLVNKTTEDMYTVSETTEGTQVNTSSVSTTDTDSYNKTSGTGNDKNEQRQPERGNSVLLILLVTCLIFGLTVVIAFFLLRLRKAHLAWKQENEEFDQSVESSKSKSSNEEKQKQNQQQRVQGLWNTSFTKYKVEEAAAASDTNTTHATVDIPDERPHLPNQTVLKSCIRETEL
ncbi:cytotoxic and regulatory T-cell molecule [Astyanax mexicanus]|uniref:Cytotoxic and regulatory T-cell molecule n=1 Tax=Astyanax mexicanus TaxID=7994 RepID=A0A8B9JJR6_ASTMX|nr:cytotoxic and regulatory T-cell molecule [Astyanax mexicanus]KAG9263608.1 cytotoxic and regulatory T-cell molecule [Astyanax mexicanus]